MQPEENKFGMRTFGMFRNPTISVESDVFQIYDKENDQVLDVKGAEFDFIDDATDETFISNHVVVFNDSNKQVLLATRKRTRDPNNGMYVLAGRAAGGPNVVWEFFRRNERKILIAVAVGDVPATVRLSAW